MANIERELKRDPQGEAEAARIASGHPREDATDATEAETPPENLRRLRGEDAKEGAKAEARTGEAIDRATAALGDEA